MFKRFMSTAVILLFVGSAAWCTAQDSATPTKSHDDTDKVVLKKIKIGDAKNVSQFGNFFMSGQFTKEDIGLLKEKGITTVITLRTDGEVKWDEKAELEKNGIKFLKVPFGRPDTLSDDVFEKVRKLLRNSAAKKQKVLLHCGSANRVGAVWAAFRACDQHVDLEMAIKESKKVGLRSPGYETKAKAYIEKHHKSHDKN